MLCDLVCDTDLSAVPRDSRAYLSKLVDGVEEAQRFVLGAEAAMAALFHLSLTPTSLVSGRQFWRLPYPKTWVEWPIGPLATLSGGKQVQGRYGVLAEESGHGVAIRFTVFNEMDSSGKATGLAAEAVIAVGDLPALQGVPLPFDASRYPSGVVQAAKELHGRVRVLRGDSDIVNHAACVLLATLLLMKAKNSGSVAPADLERLNKSRAKKGKRPLLSYHVVNLRLSETQQRRLAAQGVERAEMRAHLVRGHFKVRKTGVFWWMPYVRGDAALGWIDKHYEVKP